MAGGCTVSNDVVSVVRLANKGLSMDGWFLLCVVFEAMVGIHRTMY